MSKPAPQQKALFSVWRVSKNNPTENENYKPHMHIIISKPAPNLKLGDIITCVPISTTKVNDFSIPLQLKDVGQIEGLRHDSHILCDHIVSYRSQHFTDWLGQLEGEQLQLKIIGAVAIHLGLDE